MGIALRDDVAFLVLEFGVVYGHHILYQVFGVVVQHQFYGINHGADTYGSLVEVLATGGFHELDVVERIKVRIAYLTYEAQDGLGAVATATDAAEGRHTGVIPSVNDTFLGEYEQVALGHERVVEVQLVELKLTGTVVLYVLTVLRRLALPLFDPGDKEVIEFMVRYELQGADGVSHTFQVVTLTMREVIHGVGIPFRAGTPVGQVEHAVHDGVAEMHVGRSHVYLGTENHLARFHVAAVHLTEQAQRFLSGAVTVGAVRTSLRGGSLLLGYLLARLFVHVGTPLQYAPLGKVPEVLEIVAGIAYLAPFEAQPLDVALYGFYIFCIFFLGIRVVHAEVAHAAELLGNAEVNSNGLGMSYVQVSVRFRRKACLQSSAVLSFFQVLDYNLLDEVQAFLFCRCGVRCCHVRYVFAPV